MSLTDEEQEKIAAIKRQVAEQKRRERAEQEKQARALRARRKKAQDGIHRGARRFTLADFFRFRYMATPDIVTGLFVVLLAAIIVGAVLVPGNTAWYVRVWVAALSVVSLRLIMELSVVLFSINNHLAEISEKLDKKQG